MRINQCGEWFLKERPTSLVEYVREDVPTRYTLDDVRDVLKHVKDQDERENLTKYFMSTFERRKVGMMVAFVEDNKVLIGYSAHNPWKDEYDPLLMLSTAVGRARKWKTRRIVPKVKFNVDVGEFVPFVPTKIVGKLPNFIGRVKRYFKDKELVSWAENYK